MYFYLCFHSLIYFEAFPYFFVPYGDDLPRDRPSGAVLSIDELLDIRNADTITYIS